MGHRRRFRSAEMDAAVGERMAAWRRERGVDQGNMAEWLAMSPSQLSRFEHGRHVITLWLVMEVATLLDIPYQALIEGGMGRPQRPEDI